MEKWADPSNHNLVTKDKSLSLTTEGVALSVNTLLVRENSMADIHPGCPWCISSLVKCPLEDSGQECRLLLEALK